MNIGSMISWIRSKSFHVRIRVTAAMPAPANPADHEACRQREDRPRRVNETERDDHGVRRRRAARTTAHTVSPIATSFGPTGVARIDS